MGRRSDHSRDELYAMALDAAEKIIHADGLQALTARKVAARIGYAPGTLYNLFRNQDDLIIHLNARTLGRLDTAMRAVPLSGDAVKDLPALGKAYVGFINDHQQLWRVLFDHRLSDETEMPDWYIARIDRMMAMVEDAIAPLMPADAFEARRDAARLLWSAVHGVCSLAISGKLGIVMSTPLEEAVDHLISLMLPGMASLSKETRT